MRGREAQVGGIRRSLQGHFSLLWKFQPFLPLSLCSLGPSTRKCLRSLGARYTRPTLTLRLSDSQSHQYPDTLTPTQTHTSTHSQQPHTCSVPRMGPQHHLEAAPHGAAMRDGRFITVPSPQVAKETRANRKVRQRQGAREAGLERGTGSHLGRRTVRDTQRSLTGREKETEPTEPGGAPGTSQQEF